MAKQFFHFEQDEPTPTALDTVEHLIDVTPPTLVRQNPVDEVAQLKAEIERLNKIILHYKQDPLYSNYFAWARKANETADALNNYTLALSGDDKAFERYCKLASTQEQVTKIVDALRKDYLKLDEEKLQEIQKKGVPMIETKARANSKK